MSARGLYTVCTRPGCGGAHYARGLCRAHHAKHLTAGHLSRRVPVAAAEAHIAALTAAGASRPQIAAAAGVSTAAIHKIVRGQKYAFSDTVSRILAVQAEDIVAVGGVRVPVTGTRRRLQALATLGWSIHDLVAQPEIGTTKQGLRAVRDGDLTQCWAEVARSVESVYRRLWDQRAPWSRWASQTERRARREGWALPMEWDDIDDPDEVPSGRRIAVGQRDQALDRIERVEAWLDDPRPEWAKGTVAHLAEELGVTPRTVERDKARIRGRRARSEEDAA